MWSSFLGGPYKFLSEWGLCAQRTETFFSRLSRPPDSNRLQKAPAGFCPHNPPPNLVPQEADE